MSEDMAAGSLPEATGAATVNLSLISHTNAGKTTLARTLLGEDVGEVRDAAHVTEIATGYVMVQAGDDTLMLWDTPGFGDTARLLQRLRLSGNPIGWLLTQVWDRWRERPLWSSQQAVRNAREHADVILYLVNAAEDPADAAYVALEMEVLGWIGKPVILLLNQMGPPEPAHAEDVERWHRHVSQSAVVHSALPLDAFARCWVQEGVLLDAVAPLLAPDKQPAMARLAGEWQRRNLDRFGAAMSVLAKPLATAVQDREVLPESGLRRQVGDLFSTGKGERIEVRRARQRLTDRLDSEVRLATEALIGLHGLSGKASRKVLQRLGNEQIVSGPAKEGYAAVLGGLTSGAVGGLAADLATGGLTLGGGMIVGAILGAAGAGSAARGYNIARGEAGEAVGWNEAFCESLTRSLVLRYLAVAHFGRGRGDYEESEHPAFWEEAVREIVAESADDIRRLFKLGRRSDAATIAGQAEALLVRCTRAILLRFYPEATGLIARAAAPAPLRLE